MMDNLADADLSTLQLDDLLALDGAAEPAAAATAGARPAVAIIGMAGRVAGCDDLDAFWDLLRDGRTTRRALPEVRLQDLMAYLRLKGALQGSRAPQVFRGSFLREVDRFDHRFFGLARQEANLMDPNQRLFLETAWAALEHAGHGGAAVKGSATGVFVGLSADFGDAYREIVRTLAPDAPEVAVVGNVRSIIASRLAYHLDLHGPSMLVDTACSSGLVALHLACRALQAGDCEMAIAGAVKMDLVPVADDPQTGTGIKDIQATAAHDGCTRTFDDGSEGTSGAEGVLAFVLKRLDRALADGDTVHAIVRGSAVNQDGLSVGITAPNMAAQEALVVRALEEAQLPPEAISCVEAHGTATRLGDPVEVTALSRAYQRYTARRQFCAIGSVKSNVGHLDNAAGLAGLAKVVLAMQHRQLPASLHLRRPNRRIAFENSPFYVNDSLRPWTPPAGETMRSGISSFGLSGTNCHVIVEAPTPVTATPEVAGPHLLVLSAATEDALARLLQDWDGFLRGFDGNAADLCFTAATGRLHHAHRVAIVFHDLAMLRGQLAALAAGQPLPADAAGAAQLREAAAQYVQGAELPWAHWFPPGTARRIPLPTYPFARTRCWVEPTAAGERLAAAGAGKAIAHPLLDRCVLATRGLRVYDAVLDAAAHWELAEHKVQGHHVLPGTAFIEMLLEAARQLHGGAFRPVRLQQLRFLRPLMLEAGARCRVQLLLRETEAGHDVEIVSQPMAGAEWTLHAEARLQLLAEPAGAPQLSAVAERATEPVAYAQGEDARRGLEIGDRWNASVRQAFSDGERHLLRVQLALPDRYAADDGRYHCHPALLDTAVNAANHLLAEDALYLPFAYGQLDVLRPLPPQFEARLRRAPAEARELAHLDIELVDGNGAVCVRATGYAVKRVSAALASADAAPARLHQLQLVPVAQAAGGAPLAAPVLLVHGDADTAPPVAADLRAAGVEVTELTVAGAATVRAALAPLAGQRFGAVLYLPGGPADPVARLQELAEFARCSASLRLRVQGRMVLLTQGAFSVDAERKAVRPEAAALAALARIVRLENPQQRWRCVDGDGWPDAALLLQELVADDAAGDLAVWRGGVCHREQLAPVALPAAEAKWTAPADGVIVVTGGLGALGLALAERLAQAGAAKLALLSSTALPPASDWPARAADAATPARLRATLRRLLALQERGIELHCPAVDVADKEQLAPVLAQLRRDCGAIRGVVHAAGRAGDGFLQSKPAATFERVVAPKVRGARLLHVLTLADPLQFFVLYSSVATVLRSPGQSDYTAANAYLDALAQQRRSLGLPAVSLCWPAWREIGIAVEHGAVDEDEFFAPIAPQAALDLLAQVLAAGDNLPPVLVPGELNGKADPADLERLGIALPEALRRQRRARAVQSGAATTSVALDGLEPVDAIAQAVADAWGRVLGVSEIGADDVFADQGGNSILATQLHGIYEALYPGVVDVVDLFSHTTVREQAALIRRATGVAEPGAATDDDELSAVLARLADGSLTPAEAESLLAG